MSYIIKTINYLFQSLIIYFIFVIGRIIGLQISRKIFSFLFCKLGPLIKSKKIIIKNLNNFSNSLSDEEQNKIINGMWKNYGKTFIEYIFLNYFRKNNSHVTIIGEENLSQIYQKNKPVIFVSGHFANYELMSMEITKKNIPLATIYRPLNNIFLNPLMEYLRREFVCKNQIKKGLLGVRDAIEYIKKNHSIALMIDQRVSEGDQINFFGKPALTTTLPAQLSLKYDLEVIPVFIERIDNNFKIEFQKSLSPHNFEDKIAFTKELNRVLEKMILRNPMQWIWSHNRWK